MRADVRKGRLTVFPTRMNIISISSPVGERWHENNVLRLPSYVHDYCFYFHCSGREGAWTLRPTTVTTRVTIVSMSSPVGEKMHQNIILTVILMRAYYFHLISSGREGA